MRGGFSAITMSAQGFPSLTRQGLLKKINHTSHVGEQTDRLVSSPRASPSHHPIATVMTTVSIVDFIVFIASPFCWLSQIAAVYGQYAACRPSGVI